MEDGMRFGLGSENGRGLPHMGAGLEHKFARFDEGLVVEGGTEISGYASLFGRVDQGGDLVARGPMAPRWRRRRPRGVGSRCCGSMIRHSPSACGTSCARMRGGFGSRGGCWTVWRGAARRRP